MYNASSPVMVLDFQQDKRILIDWGTPGKSMTVEWQFRALDADRTFVAIRNWGFAGERDDQWRAAIDTTGGFSWVLAGLKAWLEHGIALNLVGDRFPAELGGKDFD